MSKVIEDLPGRLRKAIKFFWKTRRQQNSTQGAAEGSRDRGDTAAVRSGKHLDGFRQLVVDLLEEAGLKRATIYWNSKTELPGWYRAEKSWDLLVVADGKLIAILEFKSQAGSFGNNFNNRTEEAVGSATDLWAAYEEGAFKPSERPWLGYLMLLEDAPGSTASIKVREPHFKVLPEFRAASYAQRYEQLLTKLLRARLYDAACLIMSPRTGGQKGQYREPSQELTFEKFIASLLGKAIAVAVTQPGPPEPLKVETASDNA